jgi:hypothetical protein
VDACESLGICFRHYSGATAERLYPTALGSGVALDDLDGDGRIDLYLGNATDLPAGSAAVCHGNVFYRQAADGTLRDVSASAGLDVVAYTLGMLSGDYDNDGFTDVFLCAYGQGSLLRNQGDGTFAGVTGTAGLEGPQWTCSGAWFDADEDGDLDMYLARYGRWESDPRTQLGADHSLGRPMYRSPRTVAPVGHLYYRNRGDGTFQSVADQAGLRREDGRGLGVVVIDVNRDGHLDLYVANDMCPNFLYLGRGDGTFDDVSESSGAAYNGFGRAEAGMGVDAEDVTGDGWPDLFVTNFSREQSTLLANQGGAQFQDVSWESGLVRDGLAYVKWGTALLDLDLDTWPDIVMTNGQVDDNVYDLGELVPYRQPALVWRNQGQGKFENVSDRAGRFFEQRWVGRAMAFGDLDNDGDIDLAINHKDDRPAVLLNQRLHCGTDRADAGWVRFAFVGTRSNRSGIGTTVQLRVGDRVLWRQTKGGVSYMAANDPRLLVGLGPADTLERVEVRWPSGRAERLKRLRTRTTHVMHEGLGG